MSWEIVRSAALTSRQRNEDSQACRTKKRNWNEFAAQHADRLGNRNKQGRSDRWFDVIKSAALKIFRKCLNPNIFLLFKLKFTKSISFQKVSIQMCFQKKDPKIQIAVSPVASVVPLFCIQGLNNLLGNAILSQLDPILSWLEAVGPNLPATISSKHSCRSLPWWFSSNSPQSNLNLLFWLGESSRIRPGGYGSLMKSFDHGMLRNVSNSNRFESRMQMANVFINLQSWIWSFGAAHCRSALNFADWIALFIASYDTMWMPLLLLALNLPSWHWAASKSPRRPRTTLQALWF